MGAAFRKGISGSGFSGESGFLLIGIYAVRFWLAPETKIASSPESPLKVFGTQCWGLVHQMGFTSLQRHRLN